LLPEPTKGEDGKESKPRFAKEIEQLQMLQAEHENKNKGEGKSSNEEVKKSTEPTEEVPPLVEESTEPSATAAEATTETSNEATTTADDAKPPTAPDRPNEAADSQAVEEVEEFVDAAEPEPAPTVIDWSFCTDRFVHNCIAIMSLLLYLLWRKGYALYTEIQEINKQLQEPIV